MLLEKHNDDEQSQWTQNSYSCNSLIQSMVVFINSLTAGRGCFFERVMMLISRKGSGKREIGRAHV